MTIKTAVGHFTGTRDTPSVTITVWDDAQTALGYDAALAAAIAAAPASAFGALPATADIAINEQVDHAISFELRYKRPGRNILLRDTNAQTKSKKLHNFIAPVGVFDAGGDATSLHASLKWKPDRQASQSEHTLGKPITIDPLPNSRNLRYNTSQSFITDAYLDLVEDLVTRGVFNNAIYLGRAVGTLQLVQFAATENDASNWGLGFGFGYRAFQASIDVGDGVTIPELRGCDYYWLKEEEVYEDAKIQPKVTAAIVGQAWPLADLSVLNLPYPGQLTTRTSSIAGVITTVVGHGITSSDDVIIFWDGGSQIAACDSVGGSSPVSTITFSSGSGDALPPLNTNLLVAKNIP